MTEVFWLTLSEVGVLVIFIVIGYLLRVTGKVSDGKTLSALLLWVFLPAVVFKVFLENFTLTNFLSAAPYLLAGCIVFGCVLGMAYLLTVRYSERIKRNVLFYSFVVTNMSYVGFSLISAVFPEYQLYFMVFIMPFQIFVYTAGSSMLKPQKGSFSLKGLFSPVNVAMVLGMIFGIIFDLFKWEMPSLISGVIKTASACMSPAAMLLTGITLVKVPLKEVFASGEAYFLNFIRLILIPAVFGVIIYLLYIWLKFPVGIVKMAIIYLSLPFGMNSVVFAEAYGGDGSLGAKIGFISHLFCVITLPVIFAVVSVI